jgi:hypothetical protein
MLFKVLAGREKDLLDAIGVVRRHRDGLDWTYIETVVSKFERPRRGCLGVAPAAERATQKQFVRAHAALGSFAL